MSLKLPSLFELFSGNTPFLDNKKASNELTSCIKNGNDALLLGSRSFSRNEVIVSSLSSLEDSTLAIRIDAALCTDDNDFVHELFSSMKDAFPEEVCDLFVHVKPPLDSAYIDKNIHSAIKMIEEACMFLEKENAVVVLDNFDCMDKSLSVIGFLSDYTKEKNNISFVFCASEHSESDYPAWGGSLSKINVEPLSVNDFKSKCESHFNLSLSHENFQLIYDALDGQDSLVLQVCASLVANKKTSPSRANCIDAIIMLVNVKEDNFIDKFVHFPMRQKIALKSVSFAEGQKVFNGRILDRFGMIRQSLGQSISALEKRGDLIKTAPGCYRHSNVLFGLWLHPEWRICPRNVIERLA